MNKKRGYTSVAVILLAIILVAAFILVWYFGGERINVPSAGVPSSNPIDSPQANSLDSVRDKSGQMPLVGGDRDAHGCIGSAGYEWCEVKQKCLRQWEEQCGPSDLDPAFAALVAIRTSDPGVFGYATSTSSAWRSEGNMVTVVSGFTVSATGVHAKDYDLVKKYFDDKGFTASIPNEAGGPTGELAGYQKGDLVCLVGYQSTDVTLLPDRPVQVNSDTRNIDVSCGIFRP